MFLPHSPTWCLDGVHNTTGNTHRAPSACPGRRPHFTPCHFPEALFTSAHLCGQLCALRWGHMSCRFLPGVWTQGFLQGHSTCQEAIRKCSGNNSQVSYINPSLLIHQKSLSEMHPLQFLRGSPAQWSVAAQPQWKENGKPFVSFLSFCASLQPLGVTFLVTLLPPNLCPRLSSSRKTHVKAHLFLLYIPVLKLYGFYLCSCGEEKPIYWGCPSHLWTAMKMAYFL